MPAVLQVVRSKGERLKTYIKPYLVKAIKTAVKDVIEQNGGCFSDLNGDEFYEEFTNDIVTAVVETLLDHEEQ